MKCALAIDLGGTAIKGGVVSAEGRILERIEIPTGKDLSPDSVADRIADAARNLESIARQKNLFPVGLGVGSPGGICEDMRTVSQSPNFPGWKDVELVTLLEKRFDMPVCLENDANAAALGEFWVGTGKDEGISDMVFYTLGTGVGGGIILGGKVWRGAFGMAGELGHVCVEPEGRPCGCGCRGCLEQYAAGPGIVKTTREIARSMGSSLADVKELTPLAVAKAARAGDAAAHAGYASAGTYLGRGMAAVLNILNPALFLIGGGIGPSFDLMEKSMLKEMAARSFAVPAARVRVKRAVLGNDAGLLGTAKSAFDLFAKD